MAKFGRCMLDPTLTLAPASVPVPRLAVALVEEKRREAGEKGEKPLLSGSEMYIILSLH